MDNQLRAENDTRLIPHGTAPVAGRREAVRCSICTQRLGRFLFFIEETGDVTEPRQSWVLCADCNAAVHDRLEQSPVRSPMRLRVAIGLVASERTPQARRAKFGQLSDTAWMKLFGLLFFITMLVHLAIIVIVAGIHR